MRKKKFFGFCVAATVLLGTGVANAAETIGSWTSGSTTVVLTDDSVLTVSGTGAMANYENIPSVDAPWYHSRAAIKTLVINEGVARIGNCAFYGCGGLISITFDNSVTSIGAMAFYNCRGLTSVTIPNSVTSIGYSAFNGCSGLSGALTIGNSVTSIEDAAFRGCRGLTSVTIPNSVTSIGWMAFSGYDGLTSVFCLAATPPRLSYDNFTADAVDYVDTLYVPASALDAYNNSDWKSAFDIILAIESATSVKTVDADKLQAYPNPTTGVVYVDKANGAEIKVYNLSGTLLHRTRESRVDLSGEASGVYLLRVGGEALKVVKK